jgi:adenylate cyclase
MTRRLPTPLVGLLIAIALAAALVVLRQTGLLQPLELAAYDAFLPVRPVVQASDDRVVLVTIGEADIRAQGEWPLPDAVLAELLERLLAMEPRAVGLDVYRDLPEPPGSDRLASLVASTDRIITIQKAGDARSDGVPGPFFGNESRTGFNDIFTDPDGFVRRGLLFLDHNGRPLPSFALLSALTYLRDDGVSAGAAGDGSGHFRIGQTTLRPLEADDGGYARADARGYQLLLDFSGLGGQLARVSLSQVLAGEVEPAVIRDRLVLIGSVAESLKDLFFVPVHRPETSEPLAFGVEIHASAACQLIHHALGETRPQRFWSETAENLWILFGAVLGWAASFSAPSFRRLMAAGLGSGILIGGAGLLLFRQGVWIPVAPALLAGLLSAGLVTAYGAFREKRERAVLMRLFASHVSADVAEAIWRDRDRFLESGRPRPQELTATVMFTDLKNFTPISESMTPPALMEWLNDYMEAMVEIVDEHGGVVNRFIGDAILALFGIPVPRETPEEIREDARNAVRCALAMARAVERMNREMAEKGLPPVGMRVGIHTGPLIVGGLGSAVRQEYTVLGDTVNTASRFESHDKTLAAENPCRILMGAETAAHVEDLVQLKPLSALSLKGKSEPVPVFLVLGAAEEAGKGGWRTD